MLLTLLCALLGLGSPDRMFVLDKCGPRIADRDEVTVSEMWGNWAIDGEPYQIHLIGNVYTYLAPTYRNIDNIYINALYAIMTSQLGAIAN